MKNISTQIILTVLLMCHICCLATCDRNTDIEIDSANTEETIHTEIDLSLINQLREDYNLGTCTTLRGNVSVILFYLDDFESAWTEEEINCFTKNEIEPGLLFLEQEAKKYGIELDLTVEKSYSSIYYDDEVITSIKKTGLASIDVLKQAALQTGYSSSANMIEEFRSNYKTEEIVCFTIFNKNGTAYAINPKRDSDIKIDEHCIVFARDLNSAKNGPEGSQASVIAHEMLHLYGAEDFYSSSSRKKLANIHYPKDIMLSQSYNIDTNTIDDATAFYIGWTDIVPDVLNKKGW